MADKIPNGSKEEGNKNNNKAFGSLTGMFSGSDSALKPNRSFFGKEALLSSTITLHVEETHPKIPDGGWGWLVVLACLFINLASDGVSSTFGFLYVEFGDEFGASKSATSWIGSLFVAVPLVLGPIGSALVDRYGCKTMTVIGGLICTAGFVLSSFAQSIGVMYITFGLIGGIGLAFCYVTAVVSIAFWFEKRRTIALGLAASGSGFGTVIYAPLLIYLLREFRWRGTMLILAGLFANMCVSGFLMRDPEWIIEQEKERMNQRQIATSKKASRRNSISTKKEKKKNKNPQFKLQKVATAVDLEHMKRFTKSAMNLPTYLEENQEVPLIVLKNLSKNKQLYNIILQNYPNLLSARSHSDTGPDRLAADASMVTTRVPVKFYMTVEEAEEEDYDDEIPQKINTKPVDDSVIIPLIMHEKMPERQQSKGMIRSHSYLRNIRFRKESIGYRGAMLNIHKYKMQAASCPNIFKNEFDEDENEKWYEEFVDVLKDLTHFSLFLELHFFLMSIATTLMCIWFIIPHFYLADHMYENGYTDHEASFILSGIGLTNIIGMVALGWLGDKVNAIKLYAICLIACGLCCGFMMWFTTSYIMLIVTSGLFGLFFASYHALTPAILAQLVNLDMFTMAYGLSLLCQGVGKLSGPPLAGLLYDLTKSYQQPFYQAGLWTIVSGILIGIIPYVENRHILTGKIIKRDPSTMNGGHGSHFVH